MGRHAPRVGLELVLSSAHVTEQRRTDQMGARADGRAVSPAASEDAPAAGAEVVLPLGRVDQTLVRGGVDGPLAGAGDSGVARERDLSTTVRRSVKAALARWVMRKRVPDAARAARAAVLREPGLRRWTTPQDEAFHTWDGHKNFSEDFTFVAVQPGLALLARIEWMPGRQSQRVWLTLLARDRVYTLPGDGQVIEPCGDGSRWRAGGLEFDCVEPHREWRLQFRGKLLVRGRDERGPRAQAETAEEGAEGSLVPCRLDLTFLGAGEPFIPGTDDHPELVARRLGEADWNLGLLRQLRRRRLRSYVQRGAMHGMIGVATRLVAVSSASLRVHAWGGRDWGASDTAFQGFFQLGPRSLWVHHASFPWVTLEGGFVDSPDEAGADEDAGGRRSCVVDIGVTRERSPGHSPLRVGLSVVSDDARVAVEATVRSAFTLEIDRRGALVAALVEVEASAGASAGWGLWVEQRRIDPRPRALTAAPRARSS